MWTKLLNQFSYCDSKTKSSRDSLLGRKYLGGKSCGKSEKSVCNLSKWC